MGLKLSNYSTTAAMNGSIALANNATLATVAANYGLKTVVDPLTAYALQSTVDTSSEVDSKIAAALLNAVTMAALDAALLGKADAST